LLLTHFGDRRSDHAQRRADERYIWQQARDLQYEPYRTVDFERILPTLLAEARGLSVSLPYAQLRHYETERSKKRRLLPARRLFEVRTSVLFSLETYVG
jgi:hypothetical protein